MEFYGFTIQTIGELLIAFTVLRVHSRVVHDKKVDKAVLRAMKKEQFLGKIGALCIVVGFLLQIDRFL